MELTYSQIGDYLLPNLTVPDEHYNIGKYGMLRKDYLKKHRKALYSVMIINGTLFKHLAEIDKACHEVLNRIIPQMAKREGATEELKAADQMEWVRRMNNIHNRAEEFIFNEYVYGGFENEEI